MSEEFDAKSILEEAGHLVHNDRTADYGHPIDDFTRTGRIWGAILGIPDITAEQVALCMTAVKLSRQCNKPKRDNLVDGIGYLLCEARVRVERQKREATCPK